MSEIFSRAAEDIGLILSNDGENHRLTLSVDPPSANLMRVFMPTFRRRGGKIYAYGAVGLALRSSFRGEQRAYLLLDIQNVPDLQVSKADVSTIDSAHGFLKRIRFYLDELPSTIDELREVICDRNHWIGEQLTWEEFPHIRKFIDVLNEYRCELR